LCRVVDISERIKLVVQTQDVNPKIRSGRVPRYTGIADCGMRIHKEQDMKLVVCCVRVAEKFVEMLQRCLTFVCGVVDSDDLPLNVPREQLQQNRIMKVISRKFARKVLESMKKLAREAELCEIACFWHEALDM